MPASTAAGSSRLLGRQLHELGGAEPQVLQQARVAGPGPRRLEPVRHSMSLRSGASASRALVTMSSGSSSSSVSSSSASSSESVAAERIPTLSSSQIVLLVVDRHVGQPVEVGGDVDVGRRLEDHGVAAAQRLAQVGDERPRLAVVVDPHEREPRVLALDDGQTGSGAWQRISHQVGQLVEILGVVDIEVEDAPAATVPSQYGGEVRHRHMVPLRR